MDTHSDAFGEVYLIRGEEEESVAEGLRDFHEVVHLLVGDDDDTLLPVL